MGFGHKLRELRKNRDWSQEELAKTAGSHAALIGKYEREEVNPSLDALIRIAETFQVSIDYLVRDNDNFDFLKSTEIIQRIKKIETLPQQEKEKLLSVVDAFVRDYQAQKAYSA